MHVHIHNKHESALRITNVSIFVNFLLAALKIVFGVIGMSAALIADGFHSLSDIISSIIVFVGIKISSKEADKEHPYGHGKAESIAGKIVSILLIILAISIIYESVGRIIEPAQDIPGMITFWIAVISIVTKEVLYQVKSYIGKKLHSTSLIADAWHHRSDALSSIVAAAAIGATLLGGKSFVIMDPIGAIIVAGIIGYLGIKIFGKTSAELMDKMPEKSVIDNIRNVALSVENVQEVEKIRARKAGMDYFVEIHIEVIPTLTVKEGHEIAKRVKQQLESSTIGIHNALVHVEPYIPNDHEKPN